MKWIFVALLIASQAAFADGPIPKQNVATRDASAKGAAQAKPSENAVAQYRIEESTNNFNNSQIAREESPNKWIGNWLDPVGLFTGLLVLVTAYQAFITRTSLKDSKLAAEAANRSAQLAVNIQVPRLVLFKLLIQELGVGTLAANLQSPKAHVVLKNYGQTPAFLESQALGIFVGSALPKEPNYAPFAYELEPENVVEPNAQYTIEGIRPFLQAEQVTGIVEQKAYLWVFGYVQYKDFLGGKHITRFCKQLLFSALKNDHYQFSEGAVPHAYLETI
jgi:hypothetical protein